MTVLYEEVDGSYRVRRKIQEHVGVLMDTLDRGVHRPSDAVRLEGDFEDRLLQDTFDDGLEPFERVEDFDDKRTLLEYLAEIASEDLAAYHVDAFHEERPGGLYLVPRDGPILLEEDEDYVLRVISPETKVLTRATGRISPETIP